MVLPAAGLPHLKNDGAVTLMRQSHLSAWQPRQKGTDAMEWPVCTYTAYTNPALSVPVSRAVTAARALLLQLAQAPAYLTGQVVTMDGGWY